MNLGIGQVLKGRNGTYRLLESLKASSVFKAQVLPNSPIKSDFVVVKTEIDPEQFWLKRERYNHSLPAVASSHHIRRLFDVIKSEDKTDQSNAHDSFCLVLEWMDHDLSKVCSEPYRSQSKLPRVIAKSILSALAVLKSEYNAIHTDINPNNVFLSGLSQPFPVVKIGDLGTMAPEGYTKKRIQCLECRAPEVWRGLGCQHSSDVWSVAVTLVHWLSPYTIFGKRDKAIEEFDEAWCIAKLHRLVGPVDPPVDDEAYGFEFQLGEFLATSAFALPDKGDVETPFLTVGTLRQELERLPGSKVSPDLIDFILYLLVIDHTKRPTALEALQHPYLQSIC